MKKIKSTKFRDNLNISIEEEDKEKNKLGIQKRLKQDEVLNVLQAHFKIMLDRTAPTCAETDEENKDSRYLFILKKFLTHWYE